MPKFLRNDIGGLAPDASQLYYTILIKNNNAGYDASGNPTNTTILSTPIVFQETRSNPYINPAGDYYMSVIAFETDTQAIPLFICDAVPNSTDVNLTSYVITVVDNAGNVRQEILRWVPEDKTAALPPVPVPDNYDNYEYYYSYTFQWFITLINNTIATTVASLGAVNPPFLVINDTQVSLIGDLSVWNSTLANTSKYRLYFNTDLYNLFSSLPAIKVGTQPQAEANYELQFYPYPSGVNIKKIYTNLAQVPQTTYYDAIVSDCEYSPLPFWNPVDSIVFTTQQLTVVPELIAKPIAYGPNDSQYSGANAETYYVLTDYSTALKTGTEYKPNISYQPNAEFRLVDLYGEQSLNSLKISVFWKDKFGVIHPLFLEAGGNASIKILFRKKTYYVDEEKS